MYAYLYVYLSWVNTSLVYTYCLNYIRKAMLGNKEKAQVGP